VARCPVVLNMGFLSGLSQRRAYPDRLLSDLTAAAHGRVPMSRGTGSNRCIRSVSSR